MGLFDKLKFKKTEEKSGKPSPAVPVKKSVPSAESYRPAVSADGKLVATKKPSVSAKKDKIKREDTGNAYQVLIRPLITEKSSTLGAANQYVFVVAPLANKLEVKKAVKKVYGVNPTKVNIISLSGKEIRYGRTQGRTKDWKKAIITLPPGQKIEIQEGL